MNTIGAIATILTIFAFLPQTYKAVKTRKTRDISLATYSTLIITNSSVAFLSLVIVVTKVIDRD